MKKIKIWISHILKNHNLSIMPLFESDKGNGWYCPHCSWKHWDIANCRLYE